MDQQQYFSPWLRKEQSRVGFLPPKCSLLPHHPVGSFKVASHQISANVCHMNTSLSAFINCGERGVQKRDFLLLEKQAPITQLQGHGTVLTTPA